MAAALEPHDFLDWAILAYVVLGAWAGYRRGLLLSVGSLVAYLAAVGVAAAYGKPVLGLADRAGGLTRWLAERVPAALAAGAPRFAGQVLGWVAFAVVFFVARLVFVGLALRVLGGARPGGANAWLGLVFGVLERAMLAAVVLTVAASLGGILPSHALTDAIAGSAWASKLLGALRQLPAPVGRWVALL